MAEAKDRFKSQGRPADRTEDGGVDASRLVLTRNSAGGKLRAERGQKANRAALPAASAAKGERILLPRVKYGGLRRRR
jgi:hypothetical protein